MPWKGSTFPHIGFHFPLCSNQKTVPLPFPLCKYNADCRQCILLALLVYLLLPHSKFHFLLEPLFFFILFFASSEIKNLANGGYNVPGLGVIRRSSLVLPKEAAQWESKHGKDFFYPIMRSDFIKQRKKCLCKQPAGHWLSFAEFRHLLQNSIFRRTAFN